jgi:dolichol-phosphate mannosyltransferase
MSKEISIILSTYNEATVIEDTINQIFKSLDNVEIILVDDNSTDGTFEKVTKMNNPNIKAYSRTTRGLASAFLLGLINSSSNIVGWLDSNMGILAERLPEMKKQLEKNDLVLLSRYVDGASDQRSRVRILSSELINFFCQIVLSNKIKDYTSGIFLMKRDVLLSVVPISTGHGEFFIEFLYKALKSGKKIIELPYVHPPDVEGMSKTASSFLRFIILGFNYVIRIFQSLLKRN